jgi:ABC-2 type transport system permease protein
MASGSQGTLSSRESLAKNRTLNLLVNLTMREIKGQYKRTTLGRLWSLLNPLANIAVYSVVFGLLLKAPQPTGTNSHISSFALWVACGVIPWGFFASGTSVGRGSLMDNSGLLTKVYFPRFVLPTATILSLATTFLTEVAVIAVIMGIAGGPTILIRLAAIIPVVILNTAFVLGVSLVLSIAMVYFGDLQHIWGIFLQLWLYASGVVIPFSYIQQAQAGHPGIPIEALFQANPTYQFVEAYRDVLYDFSVPSLTRWVVMFAWAAGALAVGGLVFRKFSGRIVEEL